ncbi:glycosyltransferase [Xylanimonas allomyrinae]|uniref:D-inositol 3-phosphate glycosyltransferase n=1 Tax=Xylanimonas allomyrinae TaxID=2509459 RepID=A0A4P6EPA7_9MICO|nr:glycosyltransferase [Xylanimonas allomyrinae]QAY63613.1 glycosyltransferase [Xylanimonas allomyrinae]
MTARFSRVTELASNARFAASFALRALAEDPARLARLAGRRAGIALRAHRRARRAAAAVPAATVPPPSAAPAPRAAPVATSPGQDAGVRVLHHLTNSLPHTLSGYTLRSHAILRAQREAGIVAHATTRAGYPLSIGALAARHTDVVDGIAYERLIPRAVRRGPARSLTEAIDLLADVATRERAQVIHATTPATTGEVARGAAKTLGVPWVYEVRGLPEETWAASHATLAGREAAAASDRFREMRDRETSLALAADAVVTLSNTMRDELVGRGVPAARISVVPNAVADSLLEAEHPTTAQARAALGLPADGVLLGAVSSLVGYEGQDTILRTVAELRARGIEARALIVGDGAARRSLAAFAAHLRLEVGRLAILPGRVSRADAITYVAALDVVMVPRRPDRVTRLVTPLKPVEAMAIGRPVVASDLPALAEACGGAGVLVPPDDVLDWADAAERLVTDSAFRTGRVAAGHEVALTRTWGRLTATYRGVYAQAASSHAEGRRNRLPRPYAGRPASHSDDV